MKRPNVVLIVADDLGFSDIGCFGGEIRTPTLDDLARRGVRATDFYNTARCAPSRASLLTGLHPHQTGVGVLTSNDSPRGYFGSLNDRCVTMAEVLSDSGYATFLAGKWHMSAQTSSPDGTWPTRRGFDDFFGTITGCGSYFSPGTLTRGETPSDDASDPDFYYTDAISAEADKFIRRQLDAEPECPFFLYVAYTAPHWPLHAPEAVIRSYDGVYEAGWDVLRDRRMKRIVAEGLLPEGTTPSPRDTAELPWDETHDQEWQTRRMQTYAAQVEQMDRGIARIVSALEETGQLDNTLIAFLSDNGASAEVLPQFDIEAFRSRREQVPRTTRDGRPMKIGNTPDVWPGAEDAYASYGRAWANLSNTPFRLYKRWVHEGGIATPLIVHWPNGMLAGGAVVRAPAQLVDVLPTILEATGAEYPTDFNGRQISPLAGMSLLPELRGEGSLPRTLFWEHVGNAAIRMGRWKLVREFGAPWELYDLEEDRCELSDVAHEHPDKVHVLSQRWWQWADSIGVKPWDQVIRLYEERGLTSEHASG